jgi:hypothetical protein
VEQCNSPSDEVEKVQKQAMRVILTGHSHDKTLQLGGCPRLNDTRRNDICMKTLMKIAKGGALAEHTTQTRDCAHQHYIRNLF